MLASLREKLAGMIAPKRVAAAPVRPFEMRSYAGAQGGRLTAGWSLADSSADAELRGAHRNLRNRSRSLVRDFGYAKRAKVIVTNNVVGAGIGMQAQVKNARGRLETRINDEIEKAFQEWCRPEYCHTGGMLHFHDLERLTVGEIFEGGEQLTRRHKRRFGGSPIAYALETIEPERIADEFSVPFANAGSAELRNGIEVDSFYRPLGYWLRERHPGDLRTAGNVTDRIVRVPADEIWHTYVINRWPQSRGEPWLHTAIRRLHDMDGYSESEIVAARSAASYMGFIKTPDNNPLPVDAESGGERQIDFSPGMIEQLPPGSDIVMNNPNRPNPNMEPFMRLMLREVASGVGVSYESLSRDYSQSNYSSSRLALLDDRDLWRVLQGWFIRTFRLPLHREWLSMAVLSRAIPSISPEEYFLNPAKFEAVLFKPRGWGWVDPTKEVEAYKEAVRCGFTTRGRVISATADGADIEDIDTEREQELADAAAKGLHFDTDVQDPSEVSSATSAPPAAGTANQDDDDGPGDARVVPIRSVQ